ncbi:MAG: endonuclease [Variovorax sp.]|nr:MAG: endonuclease [Variovorax sp.]
MATVLPAWPTDRWWVRYLDFPRLEVLAAMAVALALLILLPRRGRWSWCGAAVLAAAIAWDAVLLAPYVAPLALPWPAPEVVSGQCAVGERLRILTVNVQMTNQHDHRLLEFVRQADPDIAWFQETDAWWEGELAPLSASMPHGVAQAQENYFGVHLFSRLPLKDTKIRQLTGSRNPSVFTTVTLPSGDLVKLYAIHPRPPQVGQSTAERDAQLMATALAASEDALPHVVMGDLNAVPWEEALQRLRHLGGFGDPRIGRGVFMTWHADHPLLRWPLDHVLPGPGWSVAAMRVLPAFGSDHLPLLVDLCRLRGPIARRSMHHDDVAQARRTVARGQGKAVDRD